MNDPASPAAQAVRRRLADWNEEHAASAYAQGWWIAQTLVERLARLAAESPDRVLIADGPTRLTARTLSTSASALAGYLLENARPGSIVSMMLPNWHEAAVVYFATTMAGMIINPILPSVRDRELAYILADLDSAFLFAPQHHRAFDYEEMFERIRGDLDEPPAFIAVRSDAGLVTDFGQLLRHAPPNELPAEDPDAVHMIMYTSGTTGRPKGVMHSQNTLHALIRQLRDPWSIDNGSRFFVPSPVSHIGGSIYAFEMPVHLGTTAVLMDTWDPIQAVATMDAERVTHMAGATPFLRDLLAAAKEQSNRLPHLAMFVCGGASVPPTLVDDANEWFERARVSRIYGSTEVPIITIGVHDHGDAYHAAHTDGRPGVAEIRLSDSGEICARGPQMFAGYYGDADTAGSRDEDGFYRSGDLGAWIKGEYLVVTGRIKDLIIRNGENIAPKEIEDILIGHPAVAEIAIVGLPDPRTGERSYAIVVDAPGAAVELDDLCAFLQRQGVARFKFPESLVHVPVLPRNDAGKVVKHLIREHLLAAKQAN